MFGTDNMIHLLSQSKEWYMDGTFGLAPKNFLQLYIIRIKHNCEYLTAIYSLLQRKTQSTYEQMFTILLNECNKRKYYPDPVKVHLDFEKAVINALKNIIGSHITIMGCFYHLCQSTHRHIQKLGLETKYRTDENFNHFCAMLDSLAFLPLSHVKEGMDYLKTVVPPDAEDLVDYFDSVYVSGPLRRIGTDDDLSIRFRRLPPQYPPPTWNVHQSTLLDSNRTNNVCEGWNNRFNHLVGHKNPSIWKLLKNMKNEVGADNAKLTLSEIGQLTYKRPHKGHIMQTRLKNLCEQFNRGELSVDIFLTNIGHNIRMKSD